METEACTILLPSDHVRTLKRAALENSGGAVRLTYAMLVRAAVRLYVEQLQINPRATINQCLPEILDEPTPAMLEAPSSTPASPSVALPPASSSSGVRSSAPRTSSGAASARKSKKKATRRR